MPLSSSRDALYNANKEGRGEKGGEGEKFWRTFSLVLVQLLSEKTTPQKKKNFVDVNKGYAQLPCC